MAAANTDKFKKLARKWVGQVGSGGVADGVATTIPLASSTNLPTDTAVVATINRVDSNGKKTPSAEESVIGVVSGSDLINCTRGAEGTAQAHSAGDVVEILVTAKGWGDLVDGILVQHNQLGLHTNITASDISASATVEALHFDLLASGDLRDANNNELLNFTQTGSAVNELTIANAATGSSPVISATGGDTNIDIILTPKGTGGVKTTKRVTTITSNATPTVNTDNCDVVTITALAANITSMTTNLSGTPTNFQTLIYRILDNGTGRTISWGASFQAMGVSLPTTTTANKVLTVGFIYDTVDSKWGCVASQEEA